MRVQNNTMDRQWNALSELSVTTVFRIRRSDLPAIQALTASPRTSRSLAFVAEKTFTSSILSAAIGALAVADAASSSILLLTVETHRNLCPPLEVCPATRRAMRLG
jgi:hypothetical protein